jgi:hypothetical protein
MSLSVSVMCIPWLSTVGPLLRLDNAVAYFVDTSMLLVDRNLSHFLSYFSELGKH